MNAAADAHELLFAAHAERAIEQVAEADRLRVHADIETGRDQPEPHQLQLDVQRLTTGQLRDLLVGKDHSQRDRNRAAQEFEFRIERRMVTA